MRRSIKKFKLAASISCLVAFPAHAQQATNYTYDALGRLVTVQQSGGPASGENETYTYDAAGNRVGYAGSLNAFITVNPATANEGSPLSFQVNRTGLTTSAVTVQYATGNGTALAGTNYTSNLGTLNFAAGITSQTISVMTSDDHVYTPNLSMTVTLSSPSAGAVLNGTSAAGAIVNIETQPVLSIASASTNEGSPLSFTVTRSGSGGGNVTVAYASSNGLAIAGTNYTSTNGTLSFVSGVITQNITVPTIDDHTATSSLGMNMTLSGPTGGAALGVAAATGTIANIDAVGWSSTLIAGTWQFCYGTCINEIGYIGLLAVGSLSNTVFNGYTISAIDSASGSVMFTESGATTPPNSGWTSIFIPGVGTLQRSSATYSTNGTGATWTWASSSTVANGTVTIQ